ncbi:hypothetical protein D3C72_2234740 [compost metagenome]
MQGHKAPRQAQHRRTIEVSWEWGRSGRQIEAVAAEQAEVVGQNVAVERLAELSAECTATDTTGQTA